MTNMEKALLFGSIGAGALSSATSARQQSKNQAQSELDAMVQRQMAALQNKQQTGQNLQDQRQQGWKDQTSQSPLGGEQSFLQKQRLAQVLFPQIANFKPAMPTDPGVAGAYVPPTNILGAFGDSRFLDTFSDQATATSLADRRKLMAGLNPDYEFSSLGQFGLDSSFDQGVNRAQQDAAGRRQAYEQTQSDLANQQYALASQQGQQQQGEEKKGGGVKGFLGGLLKTAAPFASFIPGVGPIAAIGLGAAGGALGNKMQGGGLVSGALQGGVGAGIGAAGKSLASGQGLNPFNNASKVLNNGMTAASLPVGSFAAPQTGVGLPSKGFDFTQLAQGMGDNNAAQNNMSSVISGMKPQGFQIPSSQFGPGLAPPPPAPSMPTSGPTGPTQIGAAPTGLGGRQQGDPNFRQAPEGIDDPMARRAYEQIMNSGLGRGYSDGGLNVGMMPGLTPVLGPDPKALPQGQYEMGPASAKPYVDTTATNWPSRPPAQLGAARPPAGLLGPGPSMPKQIGSGQYNMGPVGSSSPAQGSTFNLPKFGQMNMENQQNAMNILNQLSKMPKEQAAQFLATPQGQMILRNLPTAPSPYQGLSPQQMMQMVVLGGG